MKLKWSVESYFFFFSRWTVPTAKTNQNKRSLPMLERRLPSLELTRLTFMPFYQALFSFPKLVFQAYFAIFKKPSFYRYNSISTINIAMTIIQRSVVPKNILPFYQLLSYRKKSYPWLFSKIFFAQLVRENDWGGFRITQQGSQF